MAITPVSLLARDTIKCLDPKWLAKQKFLQSLEMKEGPLGEGSSASVADWETISKLNGVLYAWIPKEALAH